MALTRIKNVTATSLAEGAVEDAMVTPSGRRNLIINGDMRIAQRGTSSTGVTSSEYLCDRWEYETIGEETVTLTQSTDAPDGFANSFKVEITTADSDVTATDYAVVKQVIEAQNLQQLKYGSSDAETITVSFWVKSSVTGTYAVGLEHGETTSYYSQTYSISSADTWEKKTVTLTGNTATAINNDNGAGLHVNFALSAGTDWTSGSNGAWGAFANWLAGHSVNVIGTANATFQITGVQLEVGSVATPFEHRSYGEELALCQRYTVVYNYDTFENTLVFPGMSRAGTAKFFHITLPQSMRDVTPSISLTGEVRLLNHTTSQYKDATDTLTIGGVAPSINTSGHGLTLYYSGTITDITSTQNAMYQMMFVGDTGHQLIIDGEL